ncbi:MAG: carboxymuconolactone decarboxylase family protein [Chloroflexota bacterium]|nr:carboxymuconolactone decarboxylase family protein [Chloroflexota bacterium]
MKNQKPFNRRIYHSLRELIKDASSTMKQRKQIKILMQGGIVSTAFRERIMLTVTEVNGCRYCQYAHAKMALDAGLSQEEIETLSTGIFHHCPAEEVPALLYTQHWAEANANPEKETRQRVIEIYGQEKVEAMELVMRMIRMGNLLGNAWDYILFRISFGYWGK